MSRFTAIEGRASQYPASTNDVVWLVQQVRQLRDVIQAVLYDLDPEDTAYYDEMISALAALDEPNLPVDSNSR